MRMRVLIINTSERMGGAAIAANRLMESLNGAGIDTGMLVLHKTSHSDKVHTVGKSWQRKFTFIWERLIIWANNLFSRKNLFRISIANTGFDVTRLPVFKEADIIHLHWVNQGMLSLHNIQQVITSGKPVVWTMHDMWERDGNGDLLQPRLLGRLPFVHAVHVPADRLQYRRGGQLQLHQQLDQHRNHLPGHDARQGRLPRAGVPGQDRLRPHVRQTRCRSDDRLHAEGAQHEHLGRAGVRRAALPPAGTRRARHLRLRQTLPVRRTSPRANVSDSSRRWPWAG